MSETTKATTQAAAPAKAKKQPTKTQAKGGKATAAAKKTTPAKTTTKAAPAKPAAKPTKVELPPHPGTVWLHHLQERELSQPKAAKEMGVSGPNLNRLIRGKGIPTANVTVKFARLLGEDPATLWREVCDYELALALKAEAEGK